VLVVAAWWAAGARTVRHDPVEPAHTFAGIAPVAAPRTMAPEEAFPLIPEPRASPVARDWEALPRPPAPLFEAITAAERAPEAATPPIVQPPSVEPRRSILLVEEESSPAVPAAELAPAIEDSTAVIGDAPPADLPPTEGKAGNLVGPARHYLQFGTYRLEESVTTVQRHYQMLGLSTIIQREGDYYVLRLLPFSTREEAEQEQARLRQLGIDTLYIPPPGRP